MKRAILSLAFLAAGPVAWAQTTVHLDPADVNDAALVPGTLFTIAVKADVNHPNGLLAASFSLNYDSNVLVMQSATLGDFYDSPFVLNNWETAPGHYWHEVVSMGNWVYWGVYTIVTLEFQVMSVGSTTVTVSTGDDAVGTYTLPFFIDGTNSTVEAAGATGGSFTNVPPPPPPAPPPPPPGGGGSGGSGSPGSAASGEGKSKSGRDGCGSSAGAAGGSMMWMLAIAGFYRRSRSRRAISSEVCESPSA